MSALRFADDLVLISSDAIELQEMITQLNTESRKFGLKINIDKTKVMTNNVETPINIDEEELEYVTEYTYLRQIISFHDRQEKEIDRRIQNSCKAFWKLRNYLTTKQINIVHRRKLFNMCILPVMLYGAQTWSLTSRQQERLRVAQRGMERRMLGVTRRDKIRNDEIRRRTGVTDVVQMARNLKWSWAGHISRRSDNRWTVRITEWTPRDSGRSRGRQRRRWRDELPRNFSRLAKNRMMWSRTRMEAIFLNG